MNKKYVLLLALLLGAIYHLSVDDYKKSNKEIALILGVSEASILSFDTDYEYFYIQDYDVLEVYELSRNTIENFLSHSSFKLHDKLIVNDSIHIWNKKNWSKAPIDTSMWENEYDLALSLRCDRKKRNEISKEIRSALSSDKAFYALYSTDGRVAFYVLNITNRKLYIIYTSL